MYTGDVMKKSEFITFRTDIATKELLAAEAAKRKWSISQMVEEIIQQWIAEKATEETK